MVQRSPAQPRALIVDDEYLFALSVAADMQALGFASCDLAANGQDAFLQAMENTPDIVLMDVNLEGGREGIGSMMPSAESSTIFWLSAAIRSQSCFKSLSGSLAWMVVQTASKASSIASILLRSHSKEESGDMAPSIR